MLRDEVLVMVLRSLETWRGLLNQDLFFGFCSLTMKRIVWLCCVLPSCWTASPLAQSLGTHESWNYPFPQHLSQTLFPGMGSC